MFSIRKRGLATELKFTASRSSGSGGQHVNKTSSKVELAFALQVSQFLSDTEKERITNKLKERITDEGLLKLSCEETRSQLTNKQRAIEKFYRLLEKALTPDKIRKPTKVPVSVVLEIKKAKRIRSEIKAGRRFDRKDW